MPTRYVTAVADNTEKALQLALYGKKAAGMVYQRDNNTLYVLDPDGAGYVAIGTGTAVTSLTLAQNKVIIGDAAGLGSAADAGSAAANNITAAGTVEASKVIVLDAQKAVDSLRATTDLNIGGTGVPAAASVSTTKTKRVTALPDTTATDVFTVTIPNAEHDAIIRVDVMGILGAGGSIGQGEAVRCVSYDVVVARTAGVNAVAGVSAAIGGAASNVAGGQAITSVVATLGAVAGGVGASNTFTIKIAITRAGAGATNHIAVARAALLNANATGISIA